MTNRMRFASEYNEGAGNQRSAQNIPFIEASAEKL